MRLALLTLLLLGACTTAAVRLQNPQTGQVAECGPYFLDGLGSNSQAIRESQCISDFQRQGFQRLP